MSSGVHGAGWTSCSASWASDRPRSWFQAQGPRLARCLRRVRVLHAYPPTEEITPAALSAMQQAASGVLGPWPWTCRHPQGRRPCDHPRRPVARTATGRLEEAHNRTLQGMRRALPWPSSQEDLRLRCVPRTARPARQRIASGARRRAAGRDPCGVRTCCARFRQYNSRAHVRTLKPGLSFGDSTTAAREPSGAPDARTRSRRARRPAAAKPCAPCDTACAAPTDRRSTRRRSARDTRPAPAPADPPDACAPAAPRSQAPDGPSAGAPRTCATTRATTGPRTRDPCESAKTAPPSIASFPQTSFEAEEGSEGRHAVGRRWGQIKRPQRGQIRRPQLRGPRGGRDAGDRGR